MTRFHAPHICFAIVAACAAASTKPSRQASGTAAVFGHMRLNQGFPYLFPVLETWMEGRTVGEAYQELINAIIDKNQFKSGGFFLHDIPENARRIPQNILLYVIYGDPASQPF
jgi:hypothetical protein